MGTSQRHAKAVERRARNKLCQELRRKGELGPEVRTDLTDLSIKLGAEVGEIIEIIDLNPVMSNETRRELQRIYELRLER